MERGVDKWVKGGVLLGDGAVEKLGCNLGEIWVEMGWILGLILQSVSKKTTHRPTVAKRLNP